MDAQVLDTAPDLRFLQADSRGVELCPGPLCLTLDPRLNTLVDDVSHAQRRSLLLLKKTHRHQQLVQLRIGQCRVEHHLAPAFLRAELRSTEIDLGSLRKIASCRIVKQTL